MARLAIPLLLAILLAGCAAGNQSEAPQASVGSGGGGDWSHDGSSGGY